MLIPSLTELNKKVSYINKRIIAASLCPTLKTPFRPKPFAFIDKALNAYATIINKSGGRGSFCLSPLEGLSNCGGETFTKTEKVVDDIRSQIHPHNFPQDPSYATYGPHIPIPHYCTLSSLNKKSRMHFLIVSLNL